MISIFCCCIVDWTKLVIHSVSITYLAYLCGCVRCTYICVTLHTVSDRHANFCVGRSMHCTGISFVLHTHTQKFAASNGIIAIVQQAHWQPRHRRRWCQATTEKTKKTKNKLRCALCTWNMHAYDSIPAYTNDIPDPWPAIHRFCNRTVEPAYIYFPHWRHVLRRKKNTYFVTVFRMVIAVHAFRCGPNPTNERVAHAWEVPADVCTACNAQCAPINTFENIESLARDRRNMNTVEVTVRHPCLFVRVRHHICKKTTIIIHNIFVDECFMYTKFKWSAFLLLCAKEKYTNFLNDNNEHRSKWRSLST